MAAMDASQSVAMPAVAGQMGWSWRVGKKRQVEELWREVQGKKCGETRVWEEAALELQLGSSQWTEPPSVFQML